MRNGNSRERKENSEREREERAMRDRLFVVFRVFFPDAERIWVVHVNFFVFCEDSTKGLPSCLEILVLLY